ncbi:uncharacterized protein LOC133519469 [Cydia pomonella]|uniref:uncharacterized protein LOC133519469 n=1 Tax=Cydia pomonella TaxID=82600 RepID=UPI002ADD7D65|nr:uncharacterized protein LOC133519469 [Cydia pomonella]
MPPGRNMELLQCNLNHSPRAQDLMIQHMAEWEVAAAAVAEPYYVPQQANWVGDGIGTKATVAIVAPAMGGLPLSRVSTGPGYVVAKLGDFVLIGVYFSPNRPLHEFEAYLERLGRAVAGAAPSPIMVVGDLNAKCAAWGSPRTDPRGTVLLEWLVGLGLEVVNQGTANTCVRLGGGVYY